MIKLLPAKGRYQPKLVVNGEGAASVWAALQNITGVKRTQYGGVLVPLDERMCELAYAYCKEPLDDAAKVWYSAGIERERKLAEVLLQEDCALDHPNADKLWSFQRVSAAYCVQAGRSVLGSDMGVGKTATSIIAVESSVQHQKVLVICPNPLKTWWQVEHARWTAYPDTPVSVVHSEGRKKQLAAFTTGWLITNYAQIRVEAAPYLRSTPKGFVLEREDELRSSSPYYGMTWDWIICDEAQHLKNRKSQISFLTKQLRFKHCILSTGTSFENDPSELWSLLNLIDPERYASFWRFYELYVDYTEDEWGSRTVHGVRHPQLLRRELASRMARKTKAEVMPHLPPMLHQTIPLEMVEYQERLYKQMAEEMLMTLDSGEDIQAFNVMSQITRLRQVLSTPYAFDTLDDSCKLDAAMEIIQGTSERVVVFTQFRATVEALCNRLAQAGIAYGRIWGGMASEEVSQVEADLNAGRIQVVVATLQAGGVGLNLVGATIGVFVDKHYNPAKQKQAENRLHRGTQTRKVHIITLHCPGTVDDLVEAILERKEAMTDAVLAKSFTDELRRYLRKGGA